MLRYINLKRVKRCWHEPSTSWKGLGDVPLTMAGHRRILQAMESRNARDARDAAEQHILDAIAVNEAQGRYHEAGIPVFKEA